MSTEQNYGGKGSYATPTSQTVSSDHNPASVTGGQQTQAEISLYREKRSQAMERLHWDIVHFLDVPEGGVSPIWSINHILEHWLATEYKTLVRTNSDEDMQLWDGCLAQMLDLVSLLAGLSDTVREIDFCKQQIGGLPQIQPIR